MPLPPMEVTLYIKKADGKKALVKTIPLQSSCDSWCYESKIPQGWYLQNCAIQLIELTRPWSWFQLIQITTKSQPVCQLLRLKTILSFAWGELFYAQRSYPTVFKDSNEHFVNLRNNEAPCLANSFPIPLAARKLFHGGTGVSKQVWFFGQL